MSYQETIEKLQADKIRFDYLEATYSENKDQLTRDDLTFIIENMHVDFESIIESLQKADLEKDDRTYPHDEDSGWSDQ